MKVVFDTNIFISALAIPGSQGDKALARILEGRDELVLSRDIIREILSVLSSKFGREREALSHVAVILLELGKLVKPDHRIRVFKDDPDNRILECAIPGKADLIVTGDKEILRMKEYMGIKIQSRKDYLAS
jgi:putative PIN family toxin of toxin-antitoxin system